ncbi:MAG: phenylalanine--tRNA ligase subunit beta [Candidatus Eisenbacteria bacterium]|nr:phenylalanine--tRNA ligase subunit beta [Candidatus Eisenbacteria bacterium]
MKFGYNWLRELVAVDMEPAVLADRLAMLGFPVRAVEEVGARFPGILVGQVLEVGKHPRADRLVLCRVSVGQSVLSVVCGATNVKAGMKVPVACVGARLPDGKRIERAVIRGAASEGMLCSGSELGVSEDASGILALAEASVAGRSLDEELGVSETVIDIEVGHNRPDCLSVLGVAREVAALTGAKVTLPEPGFPSEAGRGEETVSVAVEQPSDCPRYCGAVLTGLRPQASPAWLRTRLEIAGFRSLGSVVDATNYCLATFGQPIHAFDLDRLTRKAVVVRRGRPGETLVTLDGVKRLLGPDVLLITDSDEPVALAGLMGGRATEVTDSSTRVFLESAHFDPKAVMGGSKRLGLETEASVRFSRGTDPGMARWCAEYAASLIVSLAGGAAGGLIDYYPRALPRRTVSMQPARVSAVLGGVVSEEFMKESLTRLGFEWHADSRGVQVGVPSFRHDVSEEVDLTEEVARTFGYDKFAERCANLSWVPGTDEETELFLDLCRESLVNLGLAEAITRTLVDARRATLFGKGASELVTVSNPASQEESVLRPSVLVSLLGAVGLNLRRGAENVRLFEIGKAFGIGPDGQPVEKVFAAGAMVGTKRPPSWQEPGPSRIDLFDTRGTIEGLLAKLNVDNYEVLCYDGPVADSEASGSICCNGKPLGLFGRAGRELLRAFDIESDVYVFELDAEALRAASSGRRALVEPSRFPPVKRDIAAVVDEALAQEEVARLIREIGGSLLKRLRLFDLYRGEAIEGGKKSLAYSLSFQSDERTLSDAEVDEAMARIVEGLIAGGARIRGRN